MRNRYVFPAYIYSDEYGRVGVKFPDFPDCVAWGYNNLSAMHNAKEALGACISRMEQYNADIPEPTPNERLRPESHQLIVQIEAIDIITSSKDVPTYNTVGGWSDFFFSRGKILVFCLLVFMFFVEKLISLLFRGFAIGRSYGAKKYAIGLGIILAFLLPLLFIFIIKKQQ